MPKWLKALAGAVLALGAAYALTLLPRGGGAAPSGAPSEPAKIRIESAQGKVTLEKKEGLWRVTDPIDWPADEDAVLDLARGLAGLTFESEVTSRAESHAQYELDEARAVKVSAWGAGQDKPFEVFLGKSAGFTGRTYARLPGSPAVRLAGGLTRDMADRPAARWRSRRLLPRPDIETVRVAKGKSSFLVEKSSSAWLLDRVVMDDAKAQSFLSALRTLTADEIVDGPVDLKARGLDKPAVTFDVTFSTGAPVSLAFGRGDPRPVKRSGQDVLYLVPAWRAEPLEADLTK